MILCTKCGFNNAATDAFCGSCGSFLEWSGEKADDQPAEEDEDEAPARKKSLYERFTSVIYADLTPTPTPTEQEDTPGGGPSRPGGPPSRPGGPPARPGGAPPARPGGAPPARPAGAPPARPSGAPPARPAGAPPARPSGAPPARPAGAPPARPDGAPPARPDGAPPARPDGAPPARPDGAPPARPSGAPPARPEGAPPARPDGAPPARPSGAPPARPDGATPARPSGPAPARPDGPPPTSEPEPAPDADIVASLVAASAPADDTKPDLPSATPRPTHTSEAAVTDGATGEQQPAALKPQAGTRRPKKVKPSPPSREPRKGDLICGECGEANDPARKFCSRCGESLADAAKAKIPWWRRIIPRRRRSELAAGSRPWADAKAKRKRKKRSGSGKALMYAKRGISIALLAFGLAYGLYEPFRTWVTDTRTSVTDSVMSVIRPEFEPVTAGPGTVSNVVPELDPEHPARAATDGFKNTHWIAPIPTDALRPELDITLDVPIGETVDLAKVIVHNGSSDDFQGLHRPRTLLFLFDNGEQDEITLKNQPGPQEIDISGGSGVRRLKIAINSIYESIDADAVALTEIEFFSER